MSKITKADLILGCLKGAKHRSYYNGGEGWVGFRRLNAICFRYGARIYDLRQAGHEIEKSRVHGIWYYRLKKGASDE